MHLARWQNIVRNKKLQGQFYFDQNTENLKFLTFSLTFFDSMLTLTLLVNGWGRGHPYLNNIAIFVTTPTQLFSCLVNLEELVGKC